MKLKKILIFIFILLAYSAYPDTTEKFYLSPLSSLPENPASYDIYNLWQSENIEDHKKGLKLLSLEVEKDKNNAIRLMSELVKKLKLDTKSSQTKDIVVCSTSPRRLQIVKKICGEIPDTNVSIIGIQKQQKFKFDDQEPPEEFNPDVNLESNLMALSFYKVYWNLIEAEYQKIQITKGKYIGGDFIFQNPEERKIQIGKLSEDEMKLMYSKLSGKPIKGMAGICVVDLTENEPKVVIDCESSFLLLKNKDNLLQNTDHKRAIALKYPEGVQQYIADFEEITALEHYQTYIDRGLAGNKAGGIGVQDPEFSPLIECIYGDPYVIIGMPLRSVSKALEIPSPQSDSWDSIKLILNFQLPELYDNSSQEYNIKLLIKMAAEAVSQGRLQTAANSIIKIYEEDPQKYEFVKKHIESLTAISKNNAFDVRSINQNTYLESFFIIEEILNKLNSWDDSKTLSFKTAIERDIYYSIPNGKQKSFDAFIDEIKNPSDKDQGLFENNASFDAVLTSLLMKNQTNSAFGQEAVNYQVNLNNLKDKETVRVFKSQIIDNADKQNVAVILNNLGPELIPSLALVKKLLDAGKSVTVFCSSEPHMIYDITLPDLYYLEDQLGKLDQTPFTETLRDIFTHPKLYRKALTPFDRRELLPLESYDCAIMIGENISGDFTGRNPPYNYTNRKCNTSFLFVHANKELTNLINIIKQKEMFIKPLKDYTLEYFRSGEDGFLEPVFTPLKPESRESSSRNSLLPVREHLRNLASKEKTISQSVAYLEQLKDINHSLMFNTLTAYLNGEVNSLPFNTEDNPFNEMDLAQITEKCEELIAATIQKKRNDLGISGKTSKNINLVSNLSTSPNDVLGQLLGKKSISEDKTIITDDISELLEKGILTINPSNPIAAGMALALARVWNKATVLESGIIVSTYTLIYRINKTQIEEIEWIPENEFNPKQGENYRIYTATAAINVHDLNIGKCSVKFGYGMADIEYKENFADFHDNGEINDLKNYFEDKAPNEIDDNLLSMAKNRNGEKIKDLIFKRLKVNEKILDIRNPISTALIDKIVGDPYTVIGFPADFIKNYLSQQKISFTHNNILKEIFKYQTSNKFSMLSFTRMQDMIKFRTTLQDYWRNIENTLSNQDPSLSPENRTSMEIRLLTLKIKLAQRERRLYDAVEYCDNMLHAIHEHKNWNKSRHFSKLEETLTKLLKEYRLGTKSFDKHVWNYDSVSLNLPEQTALFRKLDWITSLAFNWPGRQSAPRFFDEKGKDIKLFDYDWAGRYLFYDPCAWEKLNSMKQSLFKFKKYLNLSLNEEGLSPDDILKIILQGQTGNFSKEQINDLSLIWGDCIERTASENFRSDLQGHIREKPEPLIDHRGTQNIGKEQNKGFTFMDNILSLYETRKNENVQKKISIFLNNAGDETILALWQACILLEMGFEVTLYTSAYPTLDHDVTSDDIYFLLPYFSKIISEDFSKKGIKPKNSIKDYLDNGSLKISPFMAEYSDSINCKNRMIEEINNHDLSIVLGELWYGYIVGHGELSMTPFNAGVDDAYSFTIGGAPLPVIPTLKSGSNVFSVMVHKNARQQIEYRNPKSLQGFIPPQETAYKAYIYQLFQSEMWDSFHQEFDVTMDKELDTDAIYHDKNFASLVENLKNAASFYFSLPEDRNIFTMHSSLSEDKKTLTFKYITPTRRIQIKIKDMGIKKQDDGRDAKKAVMSVDFYVNYEGLHRENFKYEIVRRAEWAVTRIKYPSLFINHVENYLNKNTVSITHNPYALPAKVEDLTRKYIPADIKISEDRENVCTIKNPDYLSLELDTKSQIGLAIQKALHTDGTLLYAGIERKFPPKPGSDKERSIVSLAPVYLAKDGTPRFIIRNIRKDETEITVSDILESKTDNTIKSLLIDKNIAIHIKTKDNSATFNAKWIQTPPGKIVVSKEELKKSGQKKIRKSKFISAPIDPYTHCAARSIVNDYGNVEVVYSDLLRVGSILDSGFRRDDYWHDYEYLNGLPRMDFISDMYNVFQLALPHDTSGINNVFYCSALDPVTGKKIFDWEKVKNAAVRTARIAEKTGANAIDLNMGSPALAGQKGGAFLNDMIVLKDLTFLPFVDIRRTAIRDKLRENIINDKFIFPYMVLKKHNPSEAIKDLIDQLVKYVEDKTYEILDEDEKTNIEKAIYLGICQNLENTVNFHGRDLDNLKKSAADALQNKEYFASELIKSITAAVNIPVCVKTRLVPDESSQPAEADKTTGNKNYKELTLKEHNSTKNFLLALADAGAAWIVVHTRFQKEDYDKNAAKKRHKSFLKIAKEIKDTLGENAPPLILNGEITGQGITKQQMEEIFDSADGIMIATASLGNPYVFQKCRNILSGNEKYSFTMEEFFNVIKDHVKRDKIAFGEKFNLEKILLDIMQYGGSFSSPEFWKELNDFKYLDDAQKKAMNFILIEINPAIIAFMNKMKFYSYSDEEHSIDIEKLINGFHDFIILRIMPLIKSQLDMVHNTDRANKSDNAIKSKLDSTVINYIKELWGKNPERVNAFLRMKFIPCKTNPTKPCLASCPNKCRNLEHAIDNLQSDKKTSSQNISHILNEAPPLLPENVFFEEAASRFFSPIQSNSFPLDFMKNNAPFGFYMIHLDPVPGSAGYAINDLVRSKFSPDEIINRALAQIWLYKNLGAEGILIENMGDAPYLKREKVGPHVIAMMSVVSYLAKKEFPGLKYGLQILAGANIAALAVAHAMQFDMIRMEASLYGHVPDEGGFFPPDINMVTRYKASLNDCDVALVTDIQKKHSAHDTVTGDLGIGEMVLAAAENHLDGIVITGDATGKAANMESVALAKQISDIINTETQSNFAPKVFIGSGVTENLIEDIFDTGADAFIAGTSVKEDKDWRKPVSPDNALKMIEKIKQKQGQPISVKNPGNIKEQYEKKLHAKPGPPLKSSDEFKNRLAQNDLSITVFHLPPMPGNIRNRLSAEEIIEMSFQEIKKLKETNKAEAILLRNTDNTPYTVIKKIGDDDPMEITIMTILAWKTVHELGLFCGIEIDDNPFGSLACAFISSSHFISSRSFGFQLSSPSGILDMSPADLLQYRSLMGASSVLIFSNITKGKNLSYSPSGEYGTPEKMLDAQHLSGADGWIIPQTMINNPIPKGSYNIICFDNDAKINSANSISNYQPKILDCSTITPKNIYPSFPKTRNLEQAA